MKPEQEVEAGLWHRRQPALGSLVRIVGVLLFGGVMPVSSGGDRVPNLVPSPLEILVVVVQVYLWFEVVVVEWRVVLDWQVVVVEMVVMHSYLCMRVGGVVMDMVSMVVVTLVLVMAMQ